MRRKNFIKLSALASGYIFLPVGCSPKKKPKGKILDGNSNKGHLLRQSQNMPVSAVTTTDVVIVGAGVSGLSAAYHLQKNGINNFLLLDLEGAPGGNAASGANGISAYPWGAHYVPLPNNDLSEYLSFLQSCNVITNIDSTGLPIYNEEYLCFDPEERLFINGKWQEGLVPHFGVSDKEVNQLNDFMTLMDAYRKAIGSDGKQAFAIPVANSSKDKEYQQLDSVSMFDWMEQRGFTSSYLHEYINYCCRDDYGTVHKETSAWAGIHYFACRKGRGANADYADVLTWPEGNGFLVKELTKTVHSKFLGNIVVTAVTVKEQKAIVTYLNCDTGKKLQLECKQCIMAVPQFVASRLLADEARKARVKELFNYSPWLVANLQVQKLHERRGTPMSWDNVLHNSRSLGYVEATHQLIRQSDILNNITFYWPITHLTPTKAREWAANKTHSEWVELIFQELKLVHSNIESATQNIDIKLWGHAMVQPRIDFLTNTNRKELSLSISNRLHFAHTDLSGISIFEEAFYQGIGAATKVKDQLL
jgi:phytoene dehydrogenase-like protein